jgi:hypothetical protein
MRRHYGPCSACHEGKSTLQQDISLSNLPATSNIGQLIHIDLKQYRNTTLGNNNQILMSLDDYSTYMLIINMKDKSFQSIKEALHQIIIHYNSYHHTVTSFMMDEERSLTCAEGFLNANRIRLISYTPGIHEKKIERNIRTLTERERTLKADLLFELPQSLDGELRCHAADILNSVPNKNTRGRTPFELFTGTKPHIRDYVFGQAGLFYHTTPRDDNSKSKSDYGIIVGFNKDVRHKYRTYIPHRRAVFSRGSFQALATIPPEWGWKARLRPEGTLTPAPTHINHPIINQPSTNDFSQEYINIPAQDQEGMSQTAVAKHQLSSNQHQPPSQHNL